MYEMGGHGGPLPSRGVSSSCQATMAELREVQITEEKPLLPGHTPEVAKVISTPDSQARIPDPQASPSPPAFPNP